jgi:hypothetical protein
VCACRSIVATIGVNFHTPEAYFLKQREAEFDWGGVNPKSLYLAAQKHPLIDGEKGTPQTRAPRCRTRRRRSITPIDHAYVCCAL